MNHKVGDIITFTEDNVTASGRVTGTIIEVLADGFYLVSTSQLGDFAVTEDRII